MKITVIGAGGAFAGMARGNSSFLVEQGNARILIDCGMTTPYILRDEMGIPLESITDVILTHLHADHAGGLELVMLSCRWIGKTLPRVWAGASMTAGLRHYFSNLAYEQNGTYDRHGLELYADLRLSRPEGQSVAGIPLRFHRVRHVGHMPCSAISLGPLGVSGDTRDPVADPLFWHGKSLVFHEAEFGFPTEVHCPVLDLAARCCNDDVRGKPVWAYHCPADAEAPAPLAGVLQKGQTFELEA